VSKGRTEQKIFALWIEFGLRSAYDVASSVKDGDSASVGGWMSGLDWVRGKGPKVA
jgi:hypothetical protein